MDLLFLYIKKQMKNLLILFFVAFNSYSQNYLDYYFKSKGIEGAIVIYNENKEEWIFNDESEPFKNTPLAAHFNLWQALVGLKYDIFDIKENKTLKWDGVKRSFFEIRKTEWNKDTNLSEALKNENFWYFDRLRFKLSKKVYDTEVKQASIITEKNDVAVDYFWNFTTMSNPNTMIFVLKDLYENKLPFNKKDQQFLVSQLMIDSSLIVHESTTTYQGKKIDWTIGISLKNSKPVYFSLRTHYSVEEKPPLDYQQKRNLILAEIFDVLEL